MVMRLIMDLSGEMVILSVLVEVVAGAEDKEDHDFLETLVVVHPLVGVGVLTGEVVKAPNSQL